jgi:hypothetical protein
MEHCTNEGKLKVLKARYLSLPGNHVEDKHTKLGSNQSMSHNIRRHKYL